MLLRKPQAPGFLAEVISYGGFPMRRADAYTLALEDTGDKRAADLLAYGAHIATVNAEPLALETVREIRQDWERQTFPDKCPTV